MSSGIPAALLLVVVAVATSLTLNGVDGAIELAHLSTIYLPYSYRPNPVYLYNKDIAEQSAYDPSKKILYTAGNEVVHVIDVGVPSTPRVIFYTRLAGGELTDIETCADFVAVAFDNQQSPLHGMVYVFRGFDRRRGTMERLHSIRVGAVPDMLKFTSDCRKIVVAIEGELRMIDNQVVDPEGAVAIISFLGDDPRSPSRLTILDFTKFNAKADEYIARGVRWVYRGEGANITTTLSQDLEPEYVTINGDESRAFITLEENNAIAEVDLEHETIVEIHALGRKCWHNLLLDTSDMDGGVNLRSWPIYGLYQPDALKYVTIGGRGYILTANEGEEKEYDSPDFPFTWTDGQPGKYFTEHDLLDSSVPEFLREALSDDSKLGRLRLSTLDGRNPATGKFQHLHAYGGRSFSIWDEVDLSLVYDSGDEIERRAAAEFPHVFSADGQANGARPEVIMDSRSRKKGPETETLDLGEVNGKTVLFVASERPGIILIYTFPDNNVTAPAFESAHYAGSSGATWEELYTRRETRDVDPEDIRFLSDTVSPTGRPLLVVSGTTSGTVSFYHVVDRDVTRSSEQSLPNDLEPILGSMGVTSYS